MIRAQQINVLSLHCNKNEARSQKFTYYKYSTKQKLSAYMTNAAFSNVYNVTRL